MLLFGIHFNLLLERIDTGKKRTFHSSYPTKGEGLQIPITLLTQNFSWIQFPG